MCCEIYKRFRCGCTELKDIVWCPYVEEANELRDIYGVPHDDVRIDKLYDRCERVCAKRHLPQFTRCAECLTTTTAVIEAAETLSTATVGGEEAERGGGTEKQDMDTSAG